MVRMGMRLQHPVQAHAVLPHRGEDPVGRRRAGRPRFVVPVQYRIDDGALPGHRVLDEVADRVGRLVEEGTDDGAVHGSSGRFLQFI